MTIIFNGGRGFSSRLTVGGHVNDASIHRFNAVFLRLYPGHPLAYVVNVFTRVFC